MSDCNYTGFKNAGIVHAGRYSSQVSFLITKLFNNKARAEIPHGHFSYLV